MRGFCAILLLELFLAGTAHAAAETPVVTNTAGEILYVRTQPVAALLSAPAADAIVIRRLSPGEAVTVLARQAGFVSVQMADGVRGWLGEPGLTAMTPPAQRVMQLEQQIDELRAQHEAAQRSLRAAQGELRQAQQAANAARSSDDSETAALESENSRLREDLAASRSELDAARARLAQFEMSQEAARLLAASQSDADATGSKRFSAMELGVAAIAATVLVLFSTWVGALSARRRLRRRYHGLEL